MDIARPRPRRLAKTILAAITGLLVLIGLAALAFASRSSTSPAPRVDKSTVWTAKVKRGDLLRQVPVQGTLVPEHVQWLSAESAARVAHIVLKAGAQVEPDSVVIVLENPDLELAALEAERQAASAESALIQLDVKTQADLRLEEVSVAGLRADLRDAERHASAADRLAPEGLMSDLDHGDAQNKAAGLADKLSTEQARRDVLSQGRGRQIAAARAEVERLREIARFRRKQLAALQVRARVHGVVEDVPLEDGQWVAVGALLAKVAEPEHLKADVKVAEGYAKDVHKGLPVRFETGSGDFRGTIARVDPTVVGGTVRLEVSLGGALPPGARADQTVSGYVEIETLKDVVYVARPAGAQEDVTLGLFRLGPDGKTASRVPVRLARGSAREIEIASGLSAGDEIVVSDTSAWEASDAIRLE